MPPGPPLAVLVGDADEQPVVEHLDRQLVVGRADHGVRVPSGPWTPLQLPPTLTTSDGVAAASPTWRPGGARGGAVAAAIRTRASAATGSTPSSRRCSAPCRRAASPPCASTSVPGRRRRRRLADERLDVVAAPRRAGRSVPRCRRCTSSATRSAPPSASTSTTTGSCAGRGRAAALAHGRRSTRASRPSCSSPARPVQPAVRRRADRRRVAGRDHRVIASADHFLAGRAKAAADTAAAWLSRA